MPYQRSVLLCKHCSRRASVPPSELYLSTDNGLEEIGVPYQRRLRFRIASCILTPHGDSRDRRASPRSGRALIRSITACISTTALLRQAIRQPPGRIGATKPRRPSFCLSRMCGQEVAIVLILLDALTRINLLDSSLREQRTL